MTTALGERRLQACQLLVAAWLGLMVWASLPGPLPGAMFAAGSQLLALIAFILIHASLAVGWRGTAAFMLIGYVVGFGLEATSIHTGIPFGWFKHLAAGPKLLGVPPYVPLVYVFLSWPAWCLACLLTRQAPTTLSGPARWLAPPLGALILAGYDLAYDPIGSAVKGMWAYRFPGGVFGVPASNFLGWIVTGWMILAIFSAIEPRFTIDRAKAVGGRSYWLLPAVIWAGMALQYPILQLTTHAGDAFVSGRRFVIADIYAGATITALLAMLPPALAAAARALSIEPARKADAVPPEANNA